MKAILKTLFLPLALILLFNQCKKDKVEPEIHIADDAFYNALIREGVDLNEDGYISP